MRLRPFSLERYFAQHEFTTRYLLGSSDPESMPLRELLALDPELARSLGDTWLGYTESAGHPELRRVIATRYTQQRAENVLVCSGAEEPIFALMNVLLEPGDHVVAHAPGYQSHHEVARAIGATVTPWVGDPQRGWALDPDALAALLRPSTKLIVVSVPHNPTGFLFSRDAWLRVLEIVRAHGCHLLSDEVYRGTEQVPSERLPAACDLYERAISLDGLAKSYALPGLRIGWLASADRALLAAVGAYKDYLTICNAAPSEQLARIAVAHAETLFARTRARLCANVELLARFVGKHEARFAWQRPRAGTTTFVEILGQSATAFCDEVRAATGVMLVPGWHFSCPDPGAEPSGHAPPGRSRMQDTHVRFGYGRANLPEALAVLDAHLC